MKTEVYKHWPKLTLIIFNSTHTLVILYTKNGVENHDIILSLVKELAGRAMKNLKQLLHKSFISIYEVLSV